MEDMNKLRKSVATVSASNQEKQNGRFVFIKTAVATVCSPSGQTKINILLDDGAQRSFVVKKITDQLKLKPVDQICVAFTHLGQKQQSGFYNIVKLNIIGDDGKLICIEACVVDKIVTIPMRSELETASALPHIRNLKLGRSSTWWRGSRSEPSHTLFDSSRRELSNDTKFRRRSHTFHFEIAKIVSLFT
jgi:hypothetical protein